MANKKPANRIIIHEHFKTLDHVIEANKSRVLNPAFVERRTSLASQRTENGSFSGTKTFKQAIELMEKGYHEPLEKMKRAILKIGSNDTYQRPRMRNDYVGFVAHVPNTLMNLPQTMINRQRVPMKSKTIHLTYSFGANAGINPSDMIKGGINFISLVNSLEKQGYRVKIDAIWTVSASNTMAIFTVNLKEYSQTLNLLKLAFPLVHPAMLRRIGFNWLETTPNLTEREFTSGYGISLDVETKRAGTSAIDILKEAKVLRGESSYYCSILEAMRSKDINELADMMGVIR